VGQKRQTCLPSVTARRRVIVPAPLAREPGEAVPASRQVTTTEPVETLALPHTPHALPALGHVPRQVEVVVQAVAAAHRALRHQTVRPKRHHPIQAPVGVQLCQQRLPVVQVIVDPARVPARPQTVPRVRVRLRRPIGGHPPLRVEVQGVALVRLRAAVPVIRIPRAGDLVVTVERLAVPPQIGGIARPRACPARHPVILERRGVGGIAAGAGLACRPCLRFLAYAS
jgi:hypothetical protein